MVNNGMTSFTIDGVTNPTLNLVRGKTYTFNVTVANHPFWIKTVQGNGNQNGYAYGLSANGVQSGTIVFTVPALAPDTLYYNCEYHAVMTGVINISGGSFAHAVCKCVTYPLSVCLYLCVCTSRCPILHFLTLFV